MIETRRIGRLTASNVSGPVWHVLRDVGSDAHGTPRWKPACGKWARPRYERSLLLLPSGAPAPDAREWCPRCLWMWLRAGVDAQRAATGE